MPCCRNNKESQNDLLRPNPQQSSRTFAHSQQAWSSLRSLARPTTQFPQSCSNINTLLHKTPSIPDSSGIAETVDGSTLYLEGYSQWNISSAENSTCDLASTKRSCTQKVPIGVAKPTLCRISDEFPPDWTGFDNLPQTKAIGNYLSAFILGWSYVLSARLVELRTETGKDKIVYTDSKATCHTPSEASSNDHFVIPIGNCRPIRVRVVGVDPCERMWMAGDPSSSE